MNRPILKPVVNLMIDSGAYTAWRSGNPIDLSKYAEYLQRVGSEVYSYINLDVIPGERGDKHPSASQVEECAKQSWRNYIKLKKLGLNPMPVFHRGERIYWLEKILGEGCDYIGLGGIAFGTHSLRKLWLDQAFSYLCRDRGYPPVKLHGFGVTSIPLMLGYPWFSVDSTAWRKTSRFGIVYIPYQKPGGGYNYDVKPKAVVISKQPRKTGHSENMHLELMGKTTRKYVKEYIGSLGFDFEVDRDDFRMRDRMLLRYYKEMLKNHQIKPFQLSGATSFFQKTYQTEDAFKPKRLRLFFGLLDISDMPEMLLEEKIRDRLSPFMPCTRWTLEDMRKYVATGVFEKGNN